MRATLDINFTIWKINIKEPINEVNHLYTDKDLIDVKLTTELGGKCENCINSVDFYTEEYNY